jgi:hypothetical protein
MTRESREFRKAMAGRPSAQEMQVAEALERQRIAAQTQEDGHIIARSNSAFSFFAQIKPGDLPGDLYDRLAESAEGFLTALWDNGVLAVKARIADATTPNVPEDTERHVV